MPLPLAMSSPMAPAVLLSALLRSNRDVAGGGEFGSGSDFRIPGGVAGVAVTFVGGSARQQPDRDGESAVGAGVVELDEAPVAILGTSVSKVEK